MMPRTTSVPPTTWSAVGVSPSSTSASPADVSGAEDPRQQLQPILAMDPREVLSAGTDASTGPETKRQQHARERAARWMQHDAAPHEDNAREGRGLFRFALPLDAQLRQKVRSRRRRLGDGRGAPVPVIADAGRIHHQWLPDRISYEEFGFSADTINALKTMGHTVQQGGNQGVAQVIVYNQKDDMLEGGLDRRAADGGAAGK